MAIVEGLSVKIGADIGEFQRKMSAVAKEIKQQGEALQKIAGTSLSPGLIGFQNAFKGQDVTVKNLRIQLEELQKRKEGLLVTDTKSLAAINKQIASYEKLINQTAKIGQAGTRSLEQMGQTMQSVGQSMSLYISTPMALFGGVALKAAGDFEAGMNRVQAVSDATNEQMKQLSDIAKNLGATTQFSASQAASGLEFLAMAGYNAAQQMAALPGVLALAGSSGLDLGRSADIATNVLSQFRLTAEETGRVVDVLAKTVTSSNTNMEQLADAMNYLGPTAAAAVGILSNNGLQGSLGTRALGTALIRLAAPTKIAQGYIDELGLKFFDAQGKFVGLAGMVEELQRAFKGLNDQQKQAALGKIFGAEAIQELNILISTGSDKLRDFANTLENSAGKAAQVSETRMKGFNGAMKEFESALESLQIAIGESGLLEFAADFAREGANFVRTLKDTNPAILRFATTLGGLAIVVPPLIAGMGLIATGIGAVSAPIVATVAGVAALTAAFVAFRGSTEDTRKAFEAQKTIVQNLEGTIPQLLKRYRELQKEGKLSSEEQAELKKVTEDIGRLLPGAVTKFDQYGEAIGVSAEKAEELVKHEKELQKVLEKKNLQQAIDDLDDYKRKLEEVSSYLAQGGKQFTIQGRLIPFTDKERTEYLKLQAVLEGNIKTEKDHIKVLQGKKTTAEENAAAFEKYARAIGLITDTQKKDVKDTNDEHEQTVGLLNQMIEKMEELEAARDSAMSAEGVSRFNREIAILEAEMNRLSEIRPFQGLTQDQRIAQGIITEVSNAMKQAAIITEDAAKEMQGFVIPIRPQIDKKAFEKQVKDSLPKKLEGVELHTITESIRIARQEAIAFNKAFGEGLTTSQAEVQALQGEISNLIEKGFNAYDPVVQGLIDRIHEVQNASSSLSDTFGALSDNLIDGFLKAEVGAEGFGKTLISVAKQTIKSFLATALAAHIKNSVSINPIAGIALAIGGMAVINGLFGKLPKLAEGGLAYGPTRALVGEYPGARNNPEVIAPLNKLKDMISDAVGNSAGERVWRVSGTDLIGVIENTQHKRSRLN